MLEYIANEVLSIQCQVLLSILSVAESSDIVSSCWNLKQVWHQHKKIYRELVTYVLSQSAGRVNHDLQGQSASSLSGQQPGSVSEVVRSENRFVGDSNSKPGSHGDPFEGLSPEFTSLVGFCNLQFKTLSEPCQSKRKKSGMMELLGLSRLECSGILLFKKHFISWLHTSYDTFLWRMLVVIVTTVIGINSH